MVPSPSRGVEAGFRKARLCAAGTGKLCKACPPVPRRGGRGGKAVHLSQLFHKPPYTGSFTTNKEAHQFLGTAITLKKQLSTAMWRWPLWERGRPALGFLFESEMFSLLTNLGRRPTSSIEHGFG
jgi:hypothetical protein